MAARPGQVTSQEHAWTLQSIAWRTREHAPYGVYHYAGAGQASWFEFATAIIDLAGKRLSRQPEILPILTRDYPTLAIRPLDTRLDCGLVVQKFSLTLQPWQHALADTIDRLLTDKDFQ